MLTGQRRIGLIVVSFLSGIVLSPVFITPAAVAGVIEVSSSNSPASPIYSVVPDSDFAFFLFSEESFEMPVTVTLAAKHDFPLLHFDMSMQASDAAGGLLRLEEPAENSKLSSDRAIRDGGQKNAIVLSPHNAHDAPTDTNYPGSFALSRSFADLTNQDVSPEFKFIFRVMSSDIEIVAPWVKPIYKTIDSGFQGSVPESSSSVMTPYLGRSFEEDDWIVSKFVKFFLSGDSLPYFLIFIVICGGFMGLRKLIRIASPGK